MIYKRYPNTEVEIHHYQPETLKEKIELLELLADEYPYFQWILVLN